MTVIETFRRDGQIKKKTKVVVNHSNKVDPKLHQVNNKELQVSQVHSRSNKIIRDSKHLTIYMEVLILSSSNHQRRDLLWEVKVALLSIMLSPS